MKKTLKIFLWILFIGIIGFVFASIFWLADLRTPEIKNKKQSNEQIQFAKNLLNQAIKKQGLDKINQFSTYEIVGSDYWKGFLGEMGNPWDFNGDEMSMRFTIGDFDGQVEVLEGEYKGFVAGIQSWDYYQKVGDKYQTDIEDDKGKMFVLAAFHYFAEFANRLSKAPIIRYAGEENFNGKAMEKVFVSWSNEPKKEYDQYILWIGKKSGLIEATAFTTRDNPGPAPAFVYASLRFDDYKNIDGVLIPFLQTAQMMDPKEDLNDYIHQLKIKSFTWDNFEVSQIRPIKNISPIGDNKPKN